MSNTRVGQKTFVLLKLWQGGGIFFPLFIHKSFTMVLHKTLLYKLTLPKGQGQMICFCSSQICFYVVQICLTIWVVVHPIFLWWTSYSSKEESP